MILPISKAFQSLKTRLDCISNHYGGSFELPLLATGRSTFSLQANFFGEDFKMRQGGASSISGQEESEDSLSLEECLTSFDERLIQCNEYFREKA
jgi:hypothetical protein